MTSAANRIIKNSGWLYAKMSITMFISLYTTRLILDGLGASDFGIYNIVGGAIAMLGFLNSTMSNATQRFINYAEGEGNSHKKKNIFNVSLIIHIGIAFIITIILIILGFFFFNGILNIPTARINAALIVYISLIISTIFTIIAVPYDAIIISHENMRYYAFISIIESFLKLIVAFACTYSTQDRLIVYGILMACIPILLRLIMRYYCCQIYEECEENIFKYHDKKILKKMLRYAGWNFLTASSSLLTNNGLGIVLNHYFGTILNAAQGIANQVSGTLSSLSTNAMKAINPVLVKSEGAKDRNKVHYIISIGSRINYILFALFALPMIIYAPIVLKYWLKEIPEYGILFCQLQLIKSLVDRLSGNLSHAIYAQGDIKNYTIIKSIFNILPLVMVPIAFFFKAQPYWLYILWILCWEICGGFTILYYGNINVGIQVKLYLSDVVLPCISVSMIPTILLYCLSTVDGIFYDFLGLLLYISSFFFITYIYVINKDEKEMIKAFISRKLSRKQYLN